LKRAGERSREKREKFPWDEAMRFGLGVLRLSAAEFWATTPRELHAAAEGVFGRASGAPARKQLNDLMSLFPDTRIA
jgi:uncharacterized phage protein (TIGR02216 family)